MNIATTIIPIFAVITLGWVARLKGFIQPEFLGPANRLVYYIAIPAMIFHAISKASLKTQFDVAVLFITLFSIRKYVFRGQSFPLHFGVSVTENTKRLRQPACRARHERADNVTGKQPPLNSYIRKGI